jgi:hypothetical protein
VSQSKLMMHVAVYPCAERPSPHLADKLLFSYGFDRNTGKR